MRGWGRCVGSGLSRRGGWMKMRRRAQEGIDLTLTFLRAKRDETQRRATRPPVDLGIPSARTHRR
ncbi:hypothetical protein Scel_25690 [Streptomyces cellostaticus]|nr:hypothetical protein Scel_25690 [Streptomyces cellostaticus]